MGGHRGKTKEPMQWSNDNEAAFIAILYEHVKAGDLQCSTFTKDMWSKINEELLLATNADYGVDKLKGKWNRLRTEHRHFSDLLAHTGVTWDPNTNQVSAAKEVWQHFYTINKTTYSTFRRTGCKHYGVLGEIFGGTTATGGLGAASTQLPPTSAEERELEDDFLNSGVHVRTESQAEVAESSGRRRKEPKISKAAKLETCIEQWSSTVEKRSDESSMRVLYMKEKLERMQKKASDEAVSGSTPDPHSTVVCLNILNGMEGVSNEVYLKAIKAFNNPNFRTTFVMMPEARRLPILELLGEF